MAAQGSEGAGLIIQARKRLRSVKPRNEVGMSEKCPSRHFSLIPTAVQSSEHACTGPEHAAEAGLYRVFC